MVGEFAQINDSMNNLFNIIDTAEKPIFENLQIELIDLTLHNTRYGYKLPEDISAATQEIKRLENKYAGDEFVIEELRSINNLILK